MGLAIDGGGRQRPRASDDANHDGKVDDVTLKAYLAAYTNPGREASVLTNYQAPGYIAVGKGVHAYGATKTNKDEEQLVNIRQFVDPANVVASPASQQHIGAQKFLEPLQQDIEVSRMDAGILDAFRNNPYTQSLASVA
jgi:hypothetical protein